MNWLYRYYHYYSHYHHQVHFPLGHMVALQPSYEKIKIFYENLSLVYMAYLGRKKNMYIYSYITY
ncbi:unnamed protein product [Schistosoma margrebowiei]|uniref:Uncharacterized protein n=1 Tax=Schistosoma margrebowiei TaxID=48269 RepID=A0A183M344_9TREM|nr:unnamed protein product [Schistosoma margrebowiei]